MWAAFLRERRGDREERAENYNSIIFRSFPAGSLVGRRRLVEVADMGGRHTRGFEPRAQQRCRCTARRRERGHVPSIDARPEDAQVRNDYGLLLLVLRRTKDAAEVFRKGHEVDPVHNDCMENLGFNGSAVRRLSAPPRSFYNAARKSSRESSACFGM